MNPNEFDLLTTVEQGGCSAKISAQDLEKILEGQKFATHPNLLVGASTCDDACVWKMNDQQAIIQTTDFFPPVCSAAYDFGQIAAANALSDIYAMGGTAITALNLVMFPSTELDLEILKEILRGGGDKIAEAGAILAGGHSIDDKTIKYGLAVTGTVHPEKIITNSDAKVGEKLILTKPIGSGIIVAGKRLGQVSEENYQKALDNMKMLNKTASEVMQEYEIKAATDITGFSLMGHGCEMARGSGVSLSIDTKRVPLLEGSYELANEGCFPCALFKNIDHVDQDISFDKSVDYNLRMLMFDAQTSGGILMSVPENKTDSILSSLHQKGLVNSSVIGEVAPQSDQKKLIHLI